MRDLTTALSDVIQKVKHSLVVLHNGHFDVGAGIVWRNDGLILTNYHVVANGHMRAELFDGSQYTTQVFAQKPEIDLALLKIDANDLPSASTADSLNLQIGQLVMAIGHPWGQTNSVTMGLISGLPTVQTIQSGKIVQVIRSDVHLAPGFSGGPLVDAAGDVIGINTMIVGGDQGIAIPIHLAEKLTQQTFEQSHFPANYSQSGNMYSQWKNLM